MSRVFPEFHLTDDKGDTVGAMQRVETLSTSLRAHRAVIYKELISGNSYRLVIVMADGAFRIVPVKFIKSGKLYPLEIEGISICADLEFEYTDATPI